MTLDNFYLRHLIWVLRKCDITNKKTMTVTNTLTILETCDL